MRGIRPGVLGFIGALMVLSLAAAPAWATAKWELSSNAKTTVAPGEEIIYTLRVRNLGDSPTEGLATLDISLPEGLSLVEVVSAGSFNCAGTMGASTASCTHSAAIPPTGEPVQNPTAYVTALVDPSATGVLSAKFAISGGGPDISPDTTVDPTRITTEALEFGADAFEVKFADNAGAPVTKAGEHPDRFGIQLDFNRGEDPVGTNGDIWPVEPFRGYRVELPAGFGFNPSNFDQCTTEELANANEGTFPALALSRCPVGSQVGASTSWSSFGAFGSESQDILAGPVSLFNMVPPPGVFARFGVNFGSTLGTTDIFMRPGGDGFTLKFWNAARGLNTVGFNVDFWGDPGDPEHDMQRSCPGRELPSVGGPHCPPATMNAAPLLRNPTSCTPAGVGLEAKAYLTSWDHPDSSVEVTSTTHELPGYPANPQDPETPWGEEVGTTDCDEVPARGNVVLRPSTHSASSPTGLDVTVSVPNAGLENQKGTASSDIKSVKVSLPQGVTINPARAEGLRACSPGQYAVESLGSPGCPAASKIGTVSVKTPYLDETLEGSVFVAQPDDPATEALSAENPFDSMLALYLVIRNPERGVFLKLAGKVEADPVTGRLTTTVGGIPQQPFDTFGLHLDGGARSPLVTPPNCGQFTTEAELTPWSDPSLAIKSSSDFTIAQGPDGAPCSATPSATELRLQAGTLRGRAGSFSPFLAWFDGRAGNREITRPSLDLPPGLTAKLAGIKRCSEADLAATKLDSGKYEAADPICPAASRIGRTVAGFGAGPVQTYSTGHLFLAGPYRGAPMSIATVIPVTLGPFDLGTIVQRSAVRIDPKTAAVSLDASASEAIPSTLSGVGLHLADLRLHFDKPNFTLNPTSCSQMAVRGALGDLGDAAAWNLSSPFATSDCSSLGFKPRVSLRLAGNTARGGIPSMVSTLRPRRGDANIRRAEVRLPRSVQLDQGSIGTVCSKPNFQKDACPKGAVYGYAKAISPLLDRPLQGPVYLRASKRQLPDLVVALDGQVDLDLTGRLIAGEFGVGAVLGGLPDVPLEKLTLRIDGGPRGLLVNAADSCRNQARAEVALHGMSGQRARSMPELSCKGER